MFLCEDGDYRGACCELPTGEVVEVKGRRTPLYDLERELQTQGYGDCRLESFTPTGTPSLRGLVKVMAGLTVEEGPHGLTRRKYRPAKWCESATDSREAPRGTRKHRRTERRSSVNRPRAWRQRNFYTAFRCPLCPQKQTLERVSLNVRL